MTQAVEASGTETRERLMRAAEKLFAEKGYAAAAVHEITEEAGVNRALLYYYFKDKSSLYRAVIDEGVAEFGTMLDGALSGTGGYADRLGAFVRGHLALICGRATMARIVHRCLLDGGHGEVGLVDRFGAALDKLEAFFREGVAVGEFKDLDPAITARFFLGPTFIFSLWKLYEGERFSQDEIATEITRRLLEGFRR